MEPCGRITDRRCTEGGPMGRAIVCEVQVLAHFFCFGSLWGVILVSDHQFCELYFGMVACYFCVGTYVT